jgi:hypothetical protein
MREYVCDPTSGGGVSGVRRFELTGIATAVERQCSLIHTSCFQSNVNVKIAPAGIDSELHVLHVHLSKGLCCQLLLLPGKAVISAAAEGQSEAKNRRNDSPFLLMASYKVNNDN